MPTPYTLAESVAAALRHAIFQEAYIAGERLVELTIAQEMNVSQNTVRDALRLLEQEGLVVKRARYGTHVCAYTPEGAEEIYALWATVESVALRWILPNITAEQITALRHQVEQLEDSIDAGRQHEARMVRFAFHADLIAISGRPHTIDLLNRLHNQARLITRQPLAASQPAAYHDLLNALESGDLAAAQTLLQAMIIPES